MRPRRIKIASDDTGHDVHDVEADTEDRTAGRRSPARALVRPMVILAVAVVAIYVVAAVGLNVLVDTNRVREWVAPRVSDLLSRPVSTGDARVALLPRPSIHVADVRVDNLEGFDGPALAFAERVRLDVRLLPLFIGRVTVHQVHVDAPRFYLGIDESGTSNFGDLIPSGGTRSEALATPVALSIKRLAVSDASISYFNAPAARSFTVSGADAGVTLAPDGAVGWRAEIVAESDSLLARMATVTEEILHLDGPRAAITARSDGTGRTIQIEDGSFMLSGETLGVRGRVSGLSDSRPSYDLQITNDSMDAGVLAALLPGSMKSSHLPVTDGQLGVTFQVTRARTAGRPPLVRGSLHLADVALHVGGMTYVDALTGTVGVTPDTVTFDSLTGQFADGPFELSGSIARDSRVMVLAVRALPDLDALDRLGLVPEGTTLSGDADLDLSVMGRADALDSVEVAGLVTLEGVQAKQARFGVPVYVPAGEVSLAAGELSWVELPVLVGQDEVVTTGRVADLLPPADTEAVPHLEVTVQGSRIDLGAVLPTHEGAPAATYGRIAFAHLGDRRIDGRSVAAVMTDLGISRPRALPVHGTVSLELDTLDFRQYQLTALSARVELTDTSLVVDAPSFVMWGGSTTAFMELAVGDAPAAPFSLSLASAGGSAAEILASLTPIEDAVEGTLDLDFEATGALDRMLLPMADELAGEARLSIADGRLHGTGPNLVVADFLGSDGWTDVPFTAWDTDLELIDRRLEIDRSTLSGDEGSVSFRGLIQLGGIADLSLGLSIPPDRLETVSLRRTGIGQSVLDQLAAAGSALELGLRMSGPLAAPQLEPDASNAVALAP